MYPPLDSAGAVYAEKSAKVSIELCELRHNRAEFGGGLLALQGVSIALFDTVIDSGSSVYDGAGIYISDSYMELQSCHLQRNVADDNGGALFVDTGAFAFSNGAKIIIIHVEES